MSQVNKSWLDRFSSDRRYRSQYGDYLFYQHRNFDVKGLTTQGVYTLQLEKVFVELALAPQTEYQVSSALIRPLPNSLAQGRHSVWAYLTPEQMRDRNLVILGAPGTGKTTLLRHVAISMARPKTNGAPPSQIRKLPILLFLRNHAEVIGKNPHYPLLQALRETLVKWEVAIPVEWLEAQLKKGSCLIMLDGLDEVADQETRKRVVSWVEHQMDRYRRNHFVITSRPFGYINNPFQNVTVLEVLPFTMEQVDQFIHNWYLANEVMSAQRDDPGVRMEAKTGAEELIWRLRRAPALLEMANNPLLLTMIATVHRYRSSLPGRRVELYAEICEVFLGKRQEARGLMFDLTPAQKQRVLQPLAWHMMSCKQRELTLAEAVTVIDEPLQRVSPQSSGEAFLEMIVNTSGLLMEREVGTYGFAHLTFQEFLSAVHAQDQRLESQLLLRVEDGWWHEAIRLYAAQVDATNIVKACLTRKPPSIDALTLAMECLDEAREVRPDLRNVLDKLAQSVDHPQPDVRRRAAQVRLAYRQRWLVRVDEDRYVDNTDVTHAEYQLFLDEARSEGKYHQPDHWSGCYFLPDQGRWPVIGVRPLDAVAFCEWLTARGSGEWQYRLPRTHELGYMNPDNRLEPDAGAQVAYWFVSAKGFDCTRVSFSNVLLAELVRQLQQRFAYDWELHPNLRHRARAHDLILSRARQRCFALLDFDRNLNLDRLVEPDIVRDCNRVRDRVTAYRVYDLEAVLKDIIQAVQSPNLAQARSVPLEGMVALGQLLARDLQYVQDLDTAPDLARQIARALNTARDHGQKRDLVLDRDLLRALNLALRYLQELIVTLRRSYANARTRIRANTILRIDEVLREVGQNARDDAQARERLRQLLHTYLDLYLDFAILEERIGEKVPAFEGIRLVKERRQPMA